MVPIPSFSADSGTSQPNPNRDPFRVRQPTPSPSHRSPDVIPTGSRIHFATKPVDFRKSINGLSGAVRMILARDPLSGHLFVFHNKRKNGIKILWWDHGGYCLFYKRLSKGRFKVLPFKNGLISARMTSAELAALLEGIDLGRARRLKMWTPKKHQNMPGF